MRKPLIAVALTLCSLASLTAQENKSVTGQPIGGLVVKPKGKPGVHISLSANGGSSSSSGVSSNISFNPNLNLELFCGSGFGIGLDAGTFATKPNFDFNEYSSALKSLDMIAVTSNRQKWRSTYFLAGPQYTFGSTAVHKISFTASVKGGITINKAPDFYAEDQQMNQQPIAGYLAPGKNAFTIKPGVDLSYWLSEKLAIRFNAQYLMQTGQPEFVTGYKDLSKVNFDQGADKIRSQIQGLPFILSTTKGPDKYVSGGIGITFSLQKPSGGKLAGRSISEKGVSSTKGRPKSKAIADDDGLSGPEKKARDKVKNVSIKVTAAGGKNGEIALSNQQLEKLFTPLATEGFTYNSTSIIAYNDTNYLVAVFENAATKMRETIGLILHENEGSAYMSGGDKPIKCGFNIYCTCNPPLCLGCTRPGGTTVEQCGFAKTGSAKLVAYFMAFSSLQE